MKSSISKPYPLLIVPSLFSLHCGEAQELYTGTFVRSAVSSAATSSGNSLGNIYEVSQVIPATQGNPYPLTSDLPFNRPAIAFGNTTSDSQTPFYFSYTYPQNNFKLSEAHIVIDTQRDTTDTEGIFVEGVLTGRPPTTYVQASSPKLLHPLYVGNSGGFTPNTYFIDWSLAHYKQLTRNTFDLRLSQLLAGTSITEAGAVSDGFLPVATGDDSAVYQGFLVIKGYTISKSSLICSLSPTYTFTNIFLHNDGNSIHSSAFSGTVVSPYTGWVGTPASFQSNEWYYDAQLPNVPKERVSVTTATISLKVNRDSSKKSALVVNGVGIAESGFDSSMGTSAIEKWESSATATWDSLIATIPNGVDTTISINLVSLLGETKVRNLIAQGKLNISVAGGLQKVQASNNSSSRAFGSPVTGPELALAGTYNTEICEIPNNPKSPLNDVDAIPSGIDDQTSPEISSAQASEVTSSSAVIQWLTDEPATSQVRYGISSTGNVVNQSGLSTFHSVKLTGLLPYKVYTARVYSEDSNQNGTTSDYVVFQTLR